MATMSAIAVGRNELSRSDARFRAQLTESIYRVSNWLAANDYRGYDTFDGLSAKYVRPLTFNNKYLRIALQQGVRRLIINTRPLLGIPKAHSSKAMGFFAKGFTRLYQATGDVGWKDKMELALGWLRQNQSPGYSGASWGNHFDYQSRSGFIPAGMPTVVWTSLIGHAFLDAYDEFRKPEYLQTAISSCDHIVSDLNRFEEGDAICLSYTPDGYSQIHNANVLGASLLARVYSLTNRESYRDLAQKAVRFTVRHQLPDGSWYYGEESNLHWVDNFHTGYVLDSLKHYIDTTGDRSVEENLIKGYQYWKHNFFLADGIPKYYNYKTLPIDIQCCAQAIDTLVFFHDRDPNSLDLAIDVAKWTMSNMQHKSGYFFYRRYSSLLVNRTPTLHWGQATMLCALGGLYKLVQ